MNLVDLQKSLRAVEPAAVLVPPRVLENIIKQTWNLPAYYWSVPHRSNFIIDRQTLFRYVDQEDLALEPHHSWSLAAVVLQASTVMTASNPP